MTFGILQPFNASFFLLFIIIIQQIYYLHQSMHSRLVDHSQKLVFCLRENDLHNLMNTSWKFHQWWAKLIFYSINFQKIWWKTIILPSSKKHSCYDIYQHCDIYYQDHVFWMMVKLLFLIIFFENWCCSKSNY